MQVAMVTSNSIYYASGFSSLYIPKDFIPLKPGQLNDQARMVLSKVTEKYNTMVTRRPEMTFGKKSIMIVMNLLRMQILTGSVV